MNRVEHSKYTAAIRELKTYPSTGAQLLLLKPGYFSKYTKNNIVYGESMSQALERLKEVVDDAEKEGTFYSTINEYIMARIDKDKDLEDLLGPDPNDDREPSLDELLDKIPPAEVKDKISKINVPRTSSQQMISFVRSSDGRRITAPGTRYYVVRAEGKLHYKEESQVTILPTGWQDGDPIEGL